MENVERGTNGRSEHFWIKHNKSINTQPEEGTDRWAVRNNHISITPIQLVFSKGKPLQSLETLASRLGNRLGIVDQV